VRRSLSTVLAGSERQWILDAVNSEETRSFLNSIGNEPWPLTRAEARDFYFKEIGNWANNIHIAGIELQG
jgi:hypothetical protein